MNLEQFTSAHQKRFRIGKERALGLLYPPLKTIVDVGRRLMGRFSTADQMAIACYMEPPLDFFVCGCMISHPFGITFSPASVGADCRIGQNSTIGTNSRGMRPGDPVINKPRLGNRVSVNSGATISGPVTIGNNVIVAAGAFVDKDAPCDSIVYGRNEIRPLAQHHYNYLLQMVWHCEHEYRLVPGLVLRDGVMYLNHDYLRERQEFQSRWD